MKHLLFLSLFVFTFMLASSQADPGIISKAKTTYCVTFFADISDAINNGSFIEGDDQLWVGGSMNDWTMPGIDPLYEMNESEVEGIYRTSVLLENGTYYYKYFKIIDGTPSWEHGEWDGPPNREFTVNNSYVNLYDVVWPDPWGHIEEESNYFVNVYPNPTFDSFKIFCQFDGNKEDVLIILTDIENKQLLSRKISGDITEINISHLAPGLYFIRIKSPDRSFTKKLVKL